MENIFLGVLATVGILGVVFAIIHFSSKKTTPPATGAATSPVGSTDWGKEWEKWKEKIAIPLSVVAFGVIWWLNESDSFLKATHSKMFWSGVFLVVILWGCFLTLPKTFKENFSRKFFMLTALPVGLAMMLLSFISVEKVKAEIFSANTASASAQQQPAQQKVIRVQIPANNQLSDWVILPPGSVGNWRAPGNIEFLLPNGKSIKVADGDITYKLSRTYKFRLRGDPGEAVFTIN